MDCAENLPPAPGYVGLGTRTTQLPGSLDVSDRDCAFIEAAIIGLGSVSYNGQDTNQERNQGWKKPRANEPLMRRVSAVAVPLDRGTRSTRVHARCKNEIEKTSVDAGSLRNVLLTCGFVGRR